MKPAPEVLWTNDDFLQEKCSVKDIGKPVPPPLVQEEQRALIDDLPPTTMAELKQAALRVARGKMGYDEFLTKNPGFHQKFLLSMAKEQLPQAKQDVTVNISWLTPERLSYKQAPLELVQEVPQASIADAVVKPWKEPAPDGLAKTMRDFGGKPKD